ncbi:MAG TPA: TMEM175 family protein [Acidimicrobiia bacterium]|nr:TMEM175 family protein [Acidimicrobiia bacterium]
MPDEPTPQEQATGDAPADETASEARVAAAAQSPALVRYARHSTGLEFDRVAYFSDAVFAIAMTLLVVGIGIPKVAESDLLEALRGLQPEVTSFFISFVVIGNYWLAHHRFVSHLAATTPRLMTINLVYLAAIAFTPFPTALAGKYTDQAAAIVIYAITLSIASSLEAVMFVIAHREGLFRHRLPHDVVRYSVLAALIPVALFMASIPIALVDTTLALASWILIFPLEIVLDRTLKPDTYDQLLD